MRLIDADALFEVIEKSMAENPHKEKTQRAMHIHEHKYFLTLLTTFPTIQLEERTDKRTETHACDLISRQAAIDAAALSAAEWDGMYVQDINGRIRKALEKLPSAQPELKWIPCSEQLPRQGQEVICQCRANMIKVLKLNAYGDWYQDAEHCYMSGFVIAWMPLPEPYEEGETT